MKDSNSAEFWQNQYVAGSTGWDRGAVHPAVHDWIECGDLSPCRIVIPGCGHGHEVICLSQHRFEVTAIDYAAEPIDFLTERLVKEDLRANLEHRDLFKFEVSEKFDAVYEQTCLCAFQPDRRSQYAECVFDWLRPGGKLFLLMVQTDVENGPPFHCGPEEMRKLFPDNRWTWKPGPEKQYAHPSGMLFEIPAVLIRK